MEAKQTYPLNKAMERKPRQPKEHITSIFLQVIVIHASLSIFFKTVSLNLVDWLYIFSLKFSFVDHGNYKINKKNYGR